MKMLDLDSLEYKLNSHNHLTSYEIWPVLKEIRKLRESNRGLRKYIELISSTGGFPNPHEALRLVIARCKEALKKFPEGSEYD